MPRNFKAGSSYGGRKRAATYKAVGKAQRGFYTRRARAVAPYRRKNVVTSGFLGIETKFFDSARPKATMQNPVNADNGEVDPPTVNCLFAPIQGSSEQNRDGKKVMMKTIQIEGIVTVAAQVNQVLQDTAPLVYIALVLDTQTNAAQLNSEDVFKNESAQPYLAASVMRNPLQMARFKVLKKWRFPLQEVAAVYDGTNIETGGFTKPFKVYKKLDIPVLFKANAGTVADIVDNSLHVVAYCNDLTVGPQISYNARVRFVG